MYSADIAMKDAESENRDDKAAYPAPEAREVLAQASSAGKSESVNNIALSSIMVIGLLMGLAIFFFVPIVFSKMLRSAIHVGWELTVIEGLFKIALFVGYVLIISQLKDVRRVFQYHGAEHKTINAYESGSELTVDKVMRHTKVHVRCGTSFILVVLVTSIVVFAIVADICRTAVC